MVAIEANIMPPIKPVNKLKNTPVISDVCHNVGGLNYIAKNYYIDIQLSEQQIVNGEVNDARDSLRKTRAKYGV